ncbi:MAG: MerR family transcriptional regulator [Pseudonocardiaceae bacterium]
MYAATMRIGDLSAQTGVSRRLIRYYEVNGLLNSRRTTNGWREFEDDAVVRIRNIRELLDSGLNIADIQRVAPCLDRDIDPAHCHEVLAMYNDRLDVLEQQYTQVSKHRDALRRRITGV